LYKLIQNETGKYYQHLESIQPEIQKIEDPNTKRVVSVLLNLMEVLASDNARLKQENQLHKRSWFHRILWFCQWVKCLL